MHSIITNVFFLESIQLFAKAEEAKRRAEGASENNVETEGC